MTYQIIQHDCDTHNEGWATWGPFTDRASAEDFIEDYRLWLPVDGGYAFAVVVLAEPDDTFDLDPQEWAEEWAEEFAAEPEVLAGVTGSAAATTSTKGDQRGKNQS